MVLLESSAQFAVKLHQVRSRYLAPPKQNAPSPHGAQTTKNDFYYTDLLCGPNIKVTGPWSPPILSAKKKKKTPLNTSQ